MMKKFNETSLSHENLTISISTAVTKQRLSSCKASTRLYRDFNSKVLFQNQSLNVIYDSLLCTFFRNVRNVCGGLVKHDFLHEALYLFPISISRFSVWQVSKDFRREEFVQWSKLSTVLIIPAFHKRTSLTKYIPDSMYIANFLLQRACVRCLGDNSNS